MPLRSDHKKKLNTAEDRKNSSHDSCYNTMEGEQNASGDEEDPHEFLSQMGLETDEINKIHNVQVIYLLT